MTLNATNYSISKSLFEKIANAFKSAVKFIHRRGGYKAEYLKEEEVKPLIEHTYEAFSEAVDFGVKDNVIPEAMKMYLKNNTFVFSGFKTHQQLERVSRLLHDDDGHVKPFNRFLKDVQSIDKKYNRTYLQAEYNFAVASAQSAGKWHEFSQYADRYYLQYRTAKDERVREEHAILDGITLPFDDKFWDEFFPPNGWNCFVAGTPILTAKGWKPIESIKKGDLIVGGSGQYRIVIGTHAKTVDDELITIRSKRSSTTCTKNHRFLTHRGWVEAERLSSNDILIQVGKITFKQKLINTIHNTPILCRQIFMSFITKRKSSSSFAVYNHIQRWYKKIRNIEPAQKTYLKLKSFFFKMFRNNTFCRSKRLSQSTHSFRMFFASFHGCFTGFFSDVFAKERRRCFKFFSDIPNHLAVFFRFALSHMPTFLSKPVISLSKQFTRFFSSFRVIFPLRFDSFSSVANNNIILLKKFRNSSVIDFPKQTDVSVASSLNNIPQYQGIHDIDSFNTFNSFYDFLRNTFFHCRYDFVLCKDTKKSTPTMVYNLSVEKDESYIIHIGIVHNCRCEAIQVSKKRYEPSNPSEALARGRAATYKPNTDSVNKAAIFRFNPGKEQRIFPKKHPYFPKGCGDCGLNQYAIGKGKPQCVVCSVLSQKKKDYRTKIKDYVTQNLQGKITYSNNLLPEVATINKDFKKELAAHKGSIVQLIKAYDTLSHIERYLDPNATLFKEKIIHKNNGNATDMYVLQSKYKGDLSFRKGEIVQILFRREKKKNNHIIIFYYLRDWNNEREYLDWKKQTGR